jgi:outer membrane receptor protein involved in Fe transport
MVKRSFSVLHGAVPLAVKMAPLLLWTVVILMPAPLASAQESTGGIRGIVRDAQGGVLVGVTVEAASPARLGGPIVEVTNAQGLYRLDGLPIGVYRVTFTLQGFKAVHQENVRVEVGRSVQLDAQLEVGAVEESVTVTTESPVVDTVHAGYSTSFNQQLLENIPSTRTSWFDTIAYAPAVKTDQVNGNSATFIMYGTSSEQNSYQVNGIEVSSASGVVWDFPNPDYFQEVAVVGIGASAEYTGFQGGVVNIVTKSGSNQFKGTGSFYFITNKLVSSNGYPLPTAPYPYYINYVNDMGIQLGGPIRKDRIWFYGTLPGVRRQVSDIGVNPIFAAKTHAVRPYGKINAKLSSKDLFDVSLNDNIFYSPNSASIATPLIASTVEHGHNPVLTSRWTRTMGNATALEVKGGGIYIRDRLDPISDDFSTSGRTDQTTGIATANAPQAQRIYQNRTTVDATLSHNANDFIRGSHDFKFGVQVSSATQINNVSVFNNVSYNDRAGAPYQATFRDPRSTGGRVKGTGAFAQDNWTVGGRLTLNLGVRYDHTTGDVPAMDQYDTRATNTTGVSFSALGTLITFDNVSPRFGATYKLDQKGKTVAKVSYGRYYGRLPVSLFANLAPGNTTSSTYRFNAATGQYDILQSTTDPKINLAIDPNLRNQNTDQVYIGLERELIADFGVNASFVYKKDHDVIRGADPRSTYAPRTVVDPFNGQNITVFNRATAATLVLQQVVNRDDFNQDYKSFIVQAYKRFSRRWQLQSSYQWQRALGLSGGGTTIGSQAGEGTFGADPNQLINAYGRYATDSTHAYKASATVVLPYDVHLGVRESFESGRPYGRLINVTGNNQGSVTVLAEPRGAYDMPNTNDLQMRIDKDFKFAGERRLRLSLDLYNIFNVDTPVNIQNNSSQTSIPFGTAINIFQPRRAQVGFRIEF